jgi:hypothetical protein
LQFGKNALEAYLGSAGFCQTLSRSHNRYLFHFGAFEGGLAVPSPEDLAILRLLKNEKAAPYSISSPNPMKNGPRAERDRTF